MEMISPQGMNQRWQRRPESGQYEKHCIGANESHNGEIHMYDSVIEAAMA